MFAVTDKYTEANSEFYTRCYNVLEELSKSENIRVKSVILCEALKRILRNPHPILKKIIFDTLVLRKDLKLPKQTLEKMNFQLESLHLLQDSVKTPILTCLFRETDEAMKDELLKFIRKSSNSASLSERMLACKGYMILLEQSKLHSAIPQSQVQYASYRNNIPSQFEVNDVASCEEYLDGVRRCLNYQIQVKETLYTEAFDAVRLNPGIAPKLQEVFIGRLQRFLSKSSRVPIVLDQWTNENNKIIDNLPLLLALVYQMNERSRSKEDLQDRDEIFCYNIQKIQFDLEKKLGELSRCDFGIKRESLLTICLFYDMSL